MSTEKAKKWSEDAVATLLSIVGSQSPVSVAAVEQAAAELDVSSRSVAAKLRQLDHEVASMAKEKTSAFTPDQGASLASFVNDNANQLTYKQIAEGFEGGIFSAKQVQGKILALELTGLVKPAEKVEAARTYTEQEETKFVSMVQSGKFIEDIASALGKTIASVRGKALSLTRNGQIDKIPTQRESHANTAVDVVTQLGDSLYGMSVAEIATATDKTERGIKTLLTRRGLTVADYDGAAKKAKAESKTAVTA